MPPVTELQEILYEVVHNSGYTLESSQELGMSSSGGNFQAKVISKSCQDDSKVESELKTPDLRGDKTGGEAGYDRTLWYPNLKGSDSQSSH